MRGIRRAAVLVAVLAAATVGVTGAHASGPPTPVWGFADVHVHQFANLGFGGLVVWGQSFTPDDNIATALPWDDWTPGHPGDVVDKNGSPVGMTACPSPIFYSACTRHSEVLHADCPDGTGGDWLHPCAGFVVHGQGGVDDLVNNFATGSIGHAVGGYPQFDGWPRYDNVTSQAVYYDWLRRAYDGGLRLMVMLAVNNEVLCKAGNHIASYGCADMPAVDRQLQAAHDLEAFVDAKSGGPGQGWYRIVTSPAQARSVIAQGKLAVVLGIEVDTLFGCNKTNSCTPAYVNAQLDHYYGLGVRHVFPLHLTDNGYGGTAIYDDTFAFNNKIVTGDWWDYAADCGAGRDFHLDLIDTMNDLASIPVLGAAANGLLSAFTGIAGTAVPPRAPAGPNCNGRGLTPLGDALVNGMIDRHMIIDVDHMDRPTFDAAMTLAESRHYPGISSGHTGIVPMGNSPKKRHEGNKTLADLQRISDDGGLVSIILHQGSRADIRQYTRGTSAPVVFDCGNSDQAWAQVYLYAIDHLNGAVGIGSDFNGLAGEPAPRFGPNACGGDGSSAAAGISYPLTPFGGGAPLDRMTAGARTFDYNTDGLANIGMYPDFIADLQATGLSNSDLSPLFNSAEAYIRMWESASDTTAPEVSCAPAPTGWSAANVSLACTASDYPSGLANAADATFTLSTTVADGVETAAAATGSRSVCDRRGNCAAVGPFTGIKVDRKAPVLSCASDDGAWHPANVTLGCTASEGGAGLADAADASFALSTSVPAGSETAAASTGSRTVCDAVANCTTAGPVGGIKVDRKAPSIVVTAPIATAYLHNSTLTLAYSVADGGSGVASTSPTMDGAATLAGHGLASGQAIDLLNELPSGPHTFAVAAVDAVGNAATVSVPFDVIVTPEALRAEVSLFRTDGDIAKQGIATSLLAKLDAAQASRSAGDCGTAANQYAAFVAEVEAQSGKAIDPAVAAILVADARYLVAHCP